MKRQIRTYAQVSEPAGAELVAQIGAQADRLNARLARIRNTIVVASGKGGVGKSFVAAQLARALAGRGYSVGALDADVNGPSLARMLGATRARLHVNELGVHPAYTRAGCTLMSTELLLESADAPLRWREPDVGGFVWQSALETGMLREFLSDVHWGDLDALVIDLPPGTDKIARILPLLPNITAMIVVTTASTVAQAAVARSLRQLRDAGIAHLGLVRNMDGFACAHCGAVSPLFPVPATAFAGKAMDRTHADLHEDGDQHAVVDANVVNLGDDDSGSFTWASLPFDPRATAATDAGEPPAPDSPVLPALEKLMDRLQSIFDPPPTPRS